ncbi:MAG: type 4a pilus biogenesis protein PilO [Actinomycetota bacterium]
MRGKRISRRAAVVMIVAGDLLLLVFGWFLLVSPQRATAQSIARSAQATEVQVEQANAPASNIVHPVTQPKQPEIQTAYLYKLSKAMPTTADMPNLLLELTQTIRASGVALNSISPTPADATTGITSVTLTVTGDFYSLTDLIYRLRSLVAVRDGALDVSGRLFSVKAVSFTPAGQGKSLDANIQLNTYTFSAAAQAAAAAAAAPVPTTDTSTTGTTSSASADAAP